MVLSNEMVSIEQYANNKGLGQGSGGQKPHEAKTRLAFGRSVEATNLSAFWDAKNHSYLQSAWSKIIFPDFSKKIFFANISLTTQIPWHFPVFPDL